MMRPLKLRRFTRAQDSMYITLMLPPFTLFDMDRWSWEGNGRKEKYRRIVEARIRMSDVAGPFVRMRSGYPSLCR